MKKCSLLFKSIILLAIVFITNDMSAQSRSQLEAKRDDLLKEIDATNKKIEQARLAKTDAAGRIKILEVQIQKRNELMNNLCEAVDQLDNQAIQTNTEAISLQKELDKLKYDYKQVMQTAYRRHVNYHYYLMFLSSRSINTFFKWVLYIKQFDKYSEEKIQSILNNHSALMDNIYKIENSKQKKLKLVSEHEKQQKSIGNEIGEKNDLIAELAKKESTLVKKIRDKESEKLKIDKEIEKIILAEIKASKVTSKSATKKTETSNTKASLKDTPITDPTSESFAANKGNLPWPVKKAIIANGSGRREHPTVKGVYTNNKGVYVRTEPSAEVSAIFAGKVIAILYSPVYRECVLVKHGNFFTLYANLETVAVKRDTEIKAKQLIGKVAFDDTYNCPILYFEIWKGELPLPPETWLKTL